MDWLQTLKEYKIHKNCKLFFIKAFLLNINRDNAWLIIVALEILSKIVNL